jgi:hypothetical protein
LLVAAAAAAGGGYWYMNSTGKDEDVKKKAKELRDAGEAKGKEIQKEGEAKFEAAKVGAIDLFLSVYSTDALLSVSAEGRRKGICEGQILSSRSIR